MKSLKIMILIFAAAVFCGAGSHPAFSSNDDMWPAYPGKPGGSAAFIRCDGTLLKKPDGKQFLARGVAFGNHVWSNPSSSEKFTHHGPSDYARVKEMGFNSIRFYMNYGLFEDDAKPYAYKESGFEWLNKNIAAARANGIYLILNMHFPQGGFQSNGAGDALWANTENRARLVALWKEIARRYHDEEIIIGYGLVNEPVPTKSCSQWQSLAQEIIDSIRAVDPHHILFVERVNWLKFEPAASDKENIYFPDVKDPAPKKNIVYEYHMYSPIEFTHQNAFWIPYFKGKFFAYPDASRVNAEGERWAGFADVNPTAGNGSFEWKSLQGERAMPDKKEYRIGKPVIQVQNIGGSGKVWFDDVTVEEYSPAGKKLRTLSTPVDESGGWYFWSGNNSGNMESVTGIDGASGGKCMLVRGTTGDAVLSCDALRFVIDPKNAYTVSGKARGENVASGAVVRFRLDYYNCDTVYSWNKKGLQSIIDAYTRFAKRKNSPVYLGEFGLYRETFVENRGGERWLTDVLDIIITGNVNYNYHTYHEWGFGIYMNDDKFLPDPKLINEPVAEIFRSKQKKGGVRK